MAAIPIESMQPTGITASLCVGKLLYMARATVLELYIVNGFSLLFTDSVSFKESIYQIHEYQQNVIVILHSEVQVLHGLSLETLETLYIKTPGFEVFDQTSRPLSAFCATEETLLVAAGSYRNFLNLFDLSTGEQQVHRFLAGELIDIESYQNSMAILAKSNLCDPSLTLNSFSNLRLTYLQIFNVKGNKLTELMKITELPSDAYALRIGFNGYVVLAPREFIFKRLNFGDLRFRFSMLQQETEVDIEYIQELFENSFEEAINFDFRNLVKGKVINHLSNNIQLENNEIYCITQRRLPYAPRYLIPGHPVPDLYEFFKFYGYNNEEISMKMSQILNIIGDYPVCDFILEAELRRYRDSNINFIGIMNNIENYVEIPPLYNCCFECFDDKYGIVIDENGLMYTLYVDEEEIKMYPIIQADKDLPIRTDFRVHTVSCIEAHNSNDNLFTLEKAKDFRTEYTLFLGSFTQDSYVVRLEIAKDLPGVNYYNDHRQKENITGNMYRTALLEEIRKNCAIINKDTEKNIRQIVSSETTKIGLDFFSIDANKEVLKCLFPAEYGGIPCDTFQGSNLFGISEENRELLLENEDHGVLEYTYIVPSIAAVVDSTLQEMSVESQLTSLFLLNNTGVVERCQTRLTYRKITFLPNIGSKLRSIHFLYEKALAGEQEIVFIANDRAHNKIFRIFSANGTYKIEDYPMIEDLRAKIILATHAGTNGETYIATADNLFEIDFRETECRVHELSAGVLVHASICSIGMAACSQEQIVVYYFSKQRKMFTISDFAMEPKNSQIPLQFQSVHVEEYNDERVREIFPHVEQCEMLLCITFSNSSVVYVGMKQNMEMQVIFWWWPVEFGDKDYSIIGSSKTNTEIEEMDDEECWNQLLFSSVMPFYTECVGGSCFYIFAATRGGCVCIYHYNMLSHTFKLIDGYDAEISPPPDRSSYYEIDYWANSYEINQEEYYIRDNSPFCEVQEGNTRCVLITYPMPTKTTIPSARIAVPGLHGAVSIFELGTTLSSVRLRGTNLYPSNAFPPRCCFEAGGQQIVGLFDTKQATNAQDVKTTDSNAFGIFELDFGRYCSSLFDLQFERAMQCNYLQYSASLAQNTINMRRTMIALPFEADKIVYHNKTSTIVIVGSANRFEIRPPRSMTKDEVANIRIFETVQDEEDRNMKEEDIIANCHSLIERNPPPINSFANVHHEHLFLLAKNIIVDSSQMELSRLEHANEIISDMVYSTFPLRFGRYWQGHNVYMDRFGRMDRRNKNDDSTKREETFAAEHEETKQEYRELVIICSNYTLGSFQKCYGKIEIHAVEQVTEKTEKEDNELQEQMEPLMDEQYKSRALRRNININFFILKESRFPFGERHFELNKIAFEELENAVTACVASPSAKCLIIGESKHIKCYELVDSEKLQLNAQWLGLGHVTRISRFEEFFLMSDGVCESKLFVFKNEGKRISEMSTLTRDIGAHSGEFLVNQFNGQLYEVFSVNRGIAIYNFKYTERKERRERMQLVEIISTGLTTSKLLKNLTMLPLPAEEKIESGIAITIATLEGAVIQVVPVPLEICEICGLEKHFLRINGKLSVFDQQSSIGSQLTYKYSEDAKSYIEEMLQGKVRLSAGAW